MRLAIVTTHPIQYYAPVFHLLHQRALVEIKVFYTWGESSIKKYDPGFGKEIKWDIPLLQGYPYEWVKNTSKNPGTHQFNGIINPDIIEQVNSFQPTAVLVYGWAYNSHLKVIRYFKNKIPVIFRGDSTLLDEKKGARDLLKTVFLKWLYKNVDYALYVGTNNKEYFKKYGLNDNQLVFAPHAVDNDRFAADLTGEASRVRAQLSIPASKLVIMFAGKLEHKKAPAQLLEAFISLNNTNAHLLFVGTGPLEAQLKEKAKDKHNIHFMEFQNQSQMPLIYQVCDLFCLTSTGPGETWGLAINEAMACGKAILASNKTGATADLIKPGINGENFTGGSLIDLTNKLKGLVSLGKDGLNRMGENSKKLIADWNFEKQVKAIEALMKK
jgi:glycosyltransferase involved in cell wall biosynthesis